MKISILGFGHLGKSLAAGLVKADILPARDILIYDTSPDALSHAVNDLGHAALSLEDSIKNADITFIVVKSAAFFEMFDGFDLSLFEGKTVVSFMAGVTSDRIADIIGDSCKIVRAMPSIAIASCSGVIGYTAGGKALDDIFSKLGYAFEISEDEINSVMAFSACGLGFAAYILNAYSAAGAAFGFPPDVCEKITAQTFKNAIDMSNYAQTVTSVATRGGATEQGVLHFDATGLPKIIKDGMQKAYDKMK